MIIEMSSFSKKEEAVGDDLCQTGVVVKFDPVKIEENTSKRKRQRSKKNLLAAAKKLKW